VDVLDRLIFISEDGDAAFSTDDVSGAPPASVAAVDDLLYRAISDDPDSFEHEAEPAGTVHASAIVGHGGGATWTVVFELKDGSTITATGFLPLVNGRPGAGRGTVTGGSGRFRGLRGELDVRVKNPHRWSIE
jgi:hypothetical protein